MTLPAGVLGDRIVGTCMVHTAATPSGSPTPAPPLPFSAPVTDSLAGTVLIEGKPAAVVSASGLNTPPHVGLHGTDPFAVPMTQRGTVTTGAPTVLIEGKPAARTGSAATICFGAQGQLVGSAASVLIGGGT